MTFESFTSTTPIWRQFQIDTTNNESAADYNFSTSFNSTSTPNLLYPPPAITIPSLKFGELIRLIVFSTMFAIGAPLNLAALNQLLTAGRTVSASGSRMHLLKLHLNASDLMILFVYTASQICWLITYEWRGGPILCKLVKFLHTLSFGISSNVIVCIAFDRMASIFESKRRYSNDTGGKPGWRRVKISLYIAWILAILCAVPQWFVWTTFEPFAPKHSFSQCVSVWFAKDFDKNSNYRYNNRTSIGEPLITMKGYAILHVVVIFWIPALLVAVCYLQVMAWLLLQGGGNKCCKRAAANSNNGNKIAGDGEYGDTEGVGGVTGRTVGGRFFLIIYDFLTRRMTHTSVDSVQMRAVYAGDETAATAAVNVRLAGGGVANNGVDKGGGQPNNNRFSSSAPLLSPPPPAALLLAAASSNNADADQDGDGGRSTRTASNATALEQDMRRVKRRAIRISVLLVTGYIVCWFPYNFFALWQFIDEPHYLKHGVSIAALQYLIVLNSVINPFLYGTLGFMRKYTTNG